MNVPAGEVPKRGDLLHTNCGDRRERTWFILRVRRVRHGAILVRDRYSVWRARWWELEADMRMRLYLSAERNGGQVTWKPEPKTFENLRRKRQLVV